MSQVSDMIRKMFKEGDDKRDEGLTTPDNVERFDDIVYGSNPETQSLDVYRPKGVSGTLPVIISFHGGGWVYGDKERYQYYCMSLCQHGFAVVNFTYRLAPEHKFPAPLEDMNMVVEFVLKNAQKYGFDSDFVFAVGDSAGAHMLSIYACLTSNEDYARTYPFGTPADFRFKGIALNCGCYDMTVNEDTLDSTLPLMKDFLPEEGTPAEYRKISPVNFVNKYFPPVFLMTAEDDFLRKQAPLMADVLLKNNVPFLYRYYKDPYEKLSHVFHCNMKLPQAHKCNKDECEFFTSLIHD